MKISETLKCYGFIVRNCKGFTCLNTLKVLYCSIMRSKIEYGAIIWHPIYLTHSLAIERVQRKYLKFLFFKKRGFYPPIGTNYGSLLDEFQIESLATRRICIILTFLHKLCNNIIDCSVLLQKLNLVVPRIQSRQTLTFYNPCPRTNTLLKSPIYSMCKYFNKISDLCDIFASKLSEMLNTATRYFRDNSA